MLKPKIAIIFAILSILLLCVISIPYITWKIAITSTSPNWTFLTAFIGGSLDMLVLTFLTGVIYLNSEIQKSILNTNLIKEENINGGVTTD